MKIERETLAKGAATFLILEALAGKTTPAFSSEQTTPIEDKKVSGVEDLIEGKVPSQEAYDNIISGSLTLFEASATVETEQVQATSNKLVLQINNPYIVNFDLLKNDFDVIKMDTTPVIDKNSRTLVPIRFVAENLGQSVIWYGKNQQVFIGFTETEKNQFLAGEKINYDPNKNKIVLKINNNKILVNGEEKQMDTTPIIDKNGRTMVPIRFVAENLDQTVGWDSRTRQVYIGFTEAEKQALTEIPMGGGLNSEAQKTALTYIKPSFQYINDPQKVEAEITKLGYAVFSTSGVTVLIPTNIFEGISDKMDSSKTNLLLSTGVYEPEIVKEANLDQYTKNPETKFVWMLSNGNVYSFEKGINGLNVYRVTTTSRVQVEYNPITGEIKETGPQNNPVEVQMAAQFMAGGEFINVNNFYHKIERSASNVVRVYSSLEKKSTETALFDKVEKLCKAGDIMYWYNGKIAVLNNESKRDWNNADAIPKCIIYDSQLKKQEVKQTEFSYGYYPSIVFDFNLGISLTDGYRITHKANSSGQFVELTKYVPTGTANERASLVEAKINNDPVLEGKYERKVWLNDADGNKAVCLLISGELGMPERYIEVWTKTIQRCNEIDPNLTKKIVEQYGLNIICNQAEADNAGTASFLRKKIGGTMFYNCWYPGLDQWSIEDLAYSAVSIFIVESRGLYNIDHTYRTFKVDVPSEFKINDKVVETNSPLIEKQAYAVRQLEIYAGIPIDKRLKFNEFEKTNLDDAYRQMMSDLRSENGYIGKLKFGEFVHIGSMLGGYNTYVGWINGVE